MLRAYALISVIAAMTRTASAATVLLLVAAASAAVGCGQGSQVSSTPGGSPASVDSAPGMDARAPKCRYFDSREPGIEFTRAKGDEDDGVMGKLINETGATVWARYSWDGIECRLTAGAFVLFSENSEAAFYFRDREREDQVKYWEFATSIRLKDWYDSPYPTAYGSFNRLYNPPWKQSFSEGETGTFNWGRIKVEVKRDQDNLFDPVFKENGYMTDEMGDWAQFTVRIKSL